MASVMPDIEAWMYVKFENQYRRDEEKKDTDKMLLNHRPPISWNQKPYQIHPSSETCFLSTGNSSCSWNEIKAGPFYFCASLPLCHCLT